MQEDNKQKWDRLRKKLDSHFNESPSPNVTINEMMDVFGLAGIDHYIKKGSNYEKRKTQDNKDNNSTG